jgi:hypothetical protein
MVVSKLICAAACLQVAIKTILLGRVGTQSDKRRSPNAHSARGEQPSRLRSCTNVISTAKHEIKMMQPEDRSYEEVAKNGGARDCEALPCPGTVR